MMHVGAVHGRFLLPISEMKYKYGQLENSWGLRSSGGYSSDELIILDRKSEKKGLIWICEELVCMLDASPSLLTVPEREAGNVRSGPSSIYKINIFIYTNIKKRSQ
eukprot:1015480-Pleurochrysis_carterae.AAC.1